MIRTGVRISDLFHKGKAMFEEAGIPHWLYFIGHGIGTELHAPPILSADNESTLQEGTVIAIETVCTYPGEGIFHVEDAVLTTPSGPDILTGELQLMPY